MKKEWKWVMASLGIALVYYLTPLYQIVMNMVQASVSYYASTTLLISDTALISSQFITASKYLPLSIALAAVYIALITEIPKKPQNYPDDDLNVRL